MRIYKCLQGNGWFREALRVMMHHFTTFDRSDDTATVYDSIVFEIATYQSILYMLIICNSKEKSFIDVLEKENPFLLVYFSNMVGKLVEGPRQHLPIKKHMMIFLKLQRILVGSCKELTASRNQCRLAQNMKTDAGKDYLI